MRLGQRVQRFFRSADGPTSVEYAVVISMVLLICISSVQSMGALIGGSFTKVDDSLQPSGAITTKREEPQSRAGPRRSPVRATPMSGRR